MNRDMAKALVSMFGANFDKSKVKQGSVRWNEINNVLYLLNQERRTGAGIYSMSSVAKAWGDIVRYANGGILQWNTLLTDGWAVVQNGLVNDLGTDCGTAYRVLPAACWKVGDIVQDTKNRKGAMYKIVYSDTTGMVGVATGAFANLNFPITVSLTASGMSSYGSQFEKVTNLGK